LFDTPVYVRRPHPSSLPVLLEMLRSDEAVARELACYGLGKLGRDAKMALNELESMAANDSDATVRITAGFAVQKIEESLHP
jgi:HEAT repeat protein